MARAGEKMEGLEEVRDADRPSSDLIKELKRRYRQLGSIPKEYKPAHPTARDPGGAGPSVGATEPQDVNQHIGEVVDRAQVEQRIHRLEAILKERGHL
jgi:hypothetical protein